MSVKLDPRFAEQRKQSSIDHIWHCWINQRQDERRTTGEEWEHDLYEWKLAQQELHRLPKWLRRARTGALPLLHQQCSHSEVEKIDENRLICALGKDVTECPILKSVYAFFSEYTQDSGYYAELTLDDADGVAAQVCAWHIFTSVQKNRHIDTSEGYVQDESDRRFWKRVYENLAAGDEDEPLELAEDVSMRLRGEPELPGLQNA